MEIPKLDRILLVEDSYHIRALLNMTLTVLNNYQVTPFDCGETALNNASRTYALTALIKDGLSQSLPSEKLLMKSQIASLSASFLTR